MKFILMGLIKSFTKEMGRSPNIGELNLLRREADIIQKQNTIIPFPQGGKDKISPFEPRPKEGEISITIEGKTKKMTPEGIMDSLMDKGKGKAVETEAEMLERMNRQNKESVARLKKKKEKDLGEKLKDYDGDPDAMAGGGLAGALAKLKKKYGKDIIQKGKAPKKSKKKETQDMFREFNRKNKANGGPIDPSYLGIPPAGLGTGSRPGGHPYPGLDYYDDDTGAKGLMKKRKKKKKKREKKAAGGRIELAGGGGIAKLLKFLQKFKKKKIEDGYQFPEIDDSFRKKLLEKMGNRKDNVLKEFDTTGRKPNAAGGRIELSGGGAISKLLKILSAKSPAQRYKDYLASVKKRSIEGDFKSLAPELGAVSAGGILINRKMKSILEEGNELQKERFLKEYIEELNNDPSYDDRPELRDKLIEKYTESLFGERKAGGGLAYMLGEDDRTGFNKGGFNKGRRNFIKLMAGLASLPFVGKLFKGAKVAKIVPLKNTTTEMPTWFPEFIDKVTYSGVGKKIDADIMKYETKDLPGIEVYKHDDGKIFVSGKNDYSKSYEIEYEPPGYEVIDYETGKAVKTKGNFTAQEEVPVNVDMDGNMDFDAEVLESVDNILGPDTRVMEKYATGKVTKTVKDFTGDSGMKRGEYNVGAAEARYEQAADKAAENLAEQAEEAAAAIKGDDFATGGLAKLLGE